MKLSIFNVTEPCPNEKCTGEVQLRLGSFMFECSDCRYIMPRNEQLKLEAAFSRRRQRAAVGGTKWRNI